MATKKTIATQVGSGAGAAAARAETPKPKRTSTAKHSKAQASAVQDNADTAKPEPIAAARLSEREEVELTAFIYAESRGFHGGSPEEDWIRAEEEVRVRRSAAAA